MANATWRPESAGSRSVKSSITLRDRGDGTHSLPTDNVSTIDGADSVLATLQNATAANGDGTAIDLKGVKSLTIEVTGSFTATVNFEATIDDASWFVVGLKTAADGAAVTSATAVGAFKLPSDLSLSQFRARISGFTLGTVTVKARKHPR